MNIDAAMAAVEVLLDELPGFELMWIEIGIDKRLELLDQIGDAIGKELPETWKSGFDQTPER